MIKGIIKVILVIFIVFSFSACEEKSSQNTQVNKEKKEQVNFTPKLPIPESANLREMGLISLWYDAKHDPIPATQIGYAYANKLQDYEKALQWFEYSNSMKPTADNSAYACYVLQEMKQYDKAIKWCN
ncbi:MAG: hypothetical protein RBR65_04695, partial [Aliarcobacter sp.]|nr:hypothetical protein [Aliarcobacter sp.]